jgi:hypothetical protein
MRNAILTDSPYKNELASIVNAKKQKRQQIEGCSTKLMAR